jgi:hypothetical protein
MDIQEIVSYKSLTIATEIKTPAKRGIVNNAKAVLA